MVFTFELAPFFDVLERRTKRRKRSLLAGQILPALDDHIAISRIDFEAKADPLGQLGRDQRGAATEEWVVNQLKLKQQGKISHIGLSEVKPKDIDRARKAVKIVSVQNLYNVGDRL